MYLSRSFNVNPDTKTISLTLDELDPNSEYEYTITVTFFGKLLNANGSYTDADCNFTCSKEEFSLMPISKEDCNNLLTGNQIKFDGGADIPESYYKQITINVINLVLL